MILVENVVLESLIFVGSPGDFTLSVTSSVRNIIEIIHLDVDTNEKLKKI